MARVKRTNPTFETDNLAETGSGKGKKMGDSVKVILQGCHGMELLDGKTGQVKREWLTLVMIRDKDAIYNSNF